jgi:hypothetical protein
MSHLINRGKGAGLNYESKTAIGTAIKVQTTVFSFSVHADKRGQPLRYPHESRRSASGPEQCVVVGSHPFVGVTHGRKQLFQ